MRILSLLFFIFTLSFSAQATAAEVTTLTCDTAKSLEHTVVIDFFRPVNPLKPFIGFLDFNAVLSVYKNAVKVYENKSVRMTPEVYTTDINLFGEAAGVYLRLYPQINTEGEYTHYTGKLFINDLDVKAYFNFNDMGNEPGLDCR